MNGVAENLGPRLLDAPRWRLLWIAPLALFAWVLILASFARMLTQKINVQPEAPIRARLYELPPPPAPLKPAQPAAASHPIPVIRPHRPAIAHHSRPRPIVKPKPAPAAPPPSELGTAKSLKAASPPPSSTTSANSADAKGPAASSASANAGLGGDDLGAQAIYAPPPEIPDDLRDEPLSAVAVAHFIVSYTGAVTVTLTTPTENPRLNQVILDALRHWRFTPAKNNGVAINSAFDLQIPITIQ